ncbi:MFS transporter [Bifidobacterium sp. ESL0764]|uniref:MFS transporter n=1 Tax=Bifidobacterium sp. ESL0764 TaxID=2983228 RepID=UPI0023F80305|nr:MFS transporter [Bifidobacterium sp. ESL0764]WEV65362.1 MFS transporter [Bifidobacterium sp. ESL0764]
MSESIDTSSDAIAGLPQSGAKRTLLKTAILALSLILCSVSVTMAVVSSLKQDYPHASTMQLQGFVNIPVIGDIVATLIGGYLAARVGKKNICLAGTLLCFLGGFLPMFIPDLTLKTAIRVLCGFGVGLIQPLAASLIIDCFKGHEADTMMGVQSAMVGLGATIFSSAIAGIMTVNWRYFYCVYFIALLVAILVWLFIPNSVNEIGRIHKSSKDTSQPKRKMPFSAYFGMILQIVFATAYGYYTVNLSLAAEETKTITAVQAATVITVVSVASFLGGLVFGYAKRFLGMHIGIVAIALQAVAFVLWANTGSLALWYVAAVLLGLGFCWFMPYVNFLVNEHTDATLSAQATSYAFFGNSIGAFLPSYVFAGIGAVTGITSTQKSFNEAAILMVVCIVMIVVFNKTNHTKEVAAAK